MIKCNLSLIVTLDPSSHYAPADWLTSPCTQCYSGTSSEKYQHSWHCYRGWSQHTTAFTTHCHHSGETVWPDLSLVQTFFFNNWLFKVLSNYCMIWIKILTSVLSDSQSVNEFWSPQQCSILPLYPFIVRDCTLISIRMTLMIMMSHQSIIIFSSQNTFPKSVTLHMARNIFSLLCWYNFKGL